MQASDLIIVSIIDIKMVLNEKLMNYKIIDLQALQVSYKIYPHLNSYKKSFFDMLKEFRRLNMR